MIEFFKMSDCLDYLVLRPLSHINLNWELSWNYENNKYLIEEGSFAKQLNELIEEIESIKPTIKYHNNEDFLAEYVKTKFNWPVYKIGNKWICDDYAFLLEQGGFGDFDEKNLVNAASGRIHAAKKNKQNHFDDMEEGHRKILASVLAIILYHRSDRYK